MALAFQKETQKTSSQNNVVQTGFLSCKAELITHSVPETSYVVMSIIIDGAGAGTEAALSVPDGTAHFVEHELIKQPYADGKGLASDQILSLSGYLNASTDSWEMIFNVQAPVDRVAQILPIVPAMLSKPTFSIKKNNRERGVTKTEWLMRDMTSPQNRAYYAVLSAAYNQASFFRDPAGRLSGLSLVKPDHLHLFNQSTFNAKRIRVIVEGDVSFDRVKAIIDPYTTFPVLPFQEIQSSSLVGGDQRTEFPSNGSANNIIFPKPESHSLHNRAASVALLNVWSLAANKAAREVGAVYGIQFDSIMKKSHQFMGAQFIAFPQKVSVCVAQLGKTLQRIAVVGDEMGLARFRESGARSFAAEAEKKARGIDNLACMQEIYGKIFPLSEVAESTLAVTNEDIKQEARRILEGPFAFSSVGNLNRVPEPDRIAKLLGMNPH